MKSRILDFFSKKSNGGQASIPSVQNETQEQQQNPAERKRNDITTTNNNRPHKFVRFKLGDNVNHFVVEHAPGLHKQINEYHPNDREKVMREYVKLKPFQPILVTYSLSGRDNHLRSFQSTWF